MFRPATMRQLRALVLERDERVVLRELGRLGVLQLSLGRAGPDTAPLPPRDGAEALARCDQLLNRAATLRQTLELPPPSETMELLEMTLPQAGEKLRAMEEQADGLLKRRQGLMQRLNEATATCERLANYRGLDLPLNQPDQYAFLHFVTGSLPAAKLASLQQQIGGNVALLPLAERQGRQSLIAMTTQRGRAALERVLHRADFQPETLPAGEAATVDTQCEQSQREQADVAVAMAQLQAEQQALAAGFARPVAEVELVATLERRLLEAMQHFPRTEAAVLLSGWVPAAEVQVLEERLRQVTGGHCVIETVAPAETSAEEIPVLLKSSPLLRPFQRLVSAYGLPNYHELEPTVFVAVSYVLMFGMMFGDVGHGAMLATGGLVAWFGGRVTKVRDIGLLLLFGGLSSMGFGCAYGSCFGLEQFKKYALWRDPLAGDPLDLMSGAIGLGVMMISLGLVLNVINRLWRGDVIGGLLDKFGAVGVLFYWGVLVLATKFAAIQSRGLLGAAILLFIGLPIFGWALKEPLEYLAQRRAGHVVEQGGGLFAAVTESLVGAFEAVLSYLANTISFVRLAAYAMSHAAVLVAAFMMAEELRHFAVVGGALSVGVIILGNLGAIILEGVIASVQALRLEYYEFFGKFFSGGGQPFQPFRLGAGGLAMKGAPP